MGNYTAGAKTICPFYIKESDKSITCEGVVCGTTQMMRFDSVLDKRTHQKACCELRDYESLCRQAEMLAELAESNDADSVTNDANSVIAERLVLLGMNIRKSRALIGLTQDQLARLACMSRSHLCDIECGRKEPSLDTLIEIARALHTDVGSLVPPMLRKVREE